MFSDRKTSFKAPPAAVRQTSSSQAARRDRVRTIAQLVYIDSSLIITNLGLGGAEACERWYLTHCYPNADGHSLRTRDGQSA